MKQFLKVNMSALKYTFRFQEHYFVSTCFTARFLEVCLLQCLFKYKKYVTDIVVAQHFTTEIFPCNLSVDSEIRSINLVTLLQALEKPK